MRQLVLMLAIAVSSASALAQMPKVPGLDCKPKVIALYEPGPNWQQRGQFVSGHLGFLRTHLTKGTMAVGGPFHDKPGGLVILNVETPPEAEALLQEDPFIANKVSTFSVRQWAECQAENPPPTK